jgi:hypothetical protein
VAYRSERAERCYKKTALFTPSSVNDSLVPTTDPFRDPEHRKILLSGLRLAAGEGAR